MGSVDLQLARDLARTAGLRRAVETGTYHGTTARLLAGVFPAVVTIEYDETLHRQAVARLASVPAITALQGHSVSRLGEVDDPATPTLFFLDGHWSGAETAGVEDECPVLEELEAIGAGNPADCVIIDDARMFTSAPPPPHRPEQWPTIVEVFDALRRFRPEHHVTLLNDQVVAVPQPARPALDAYAFRLQASQRSALDRARAVAFRLRQSLPRPG